MRYAQKERLCFVLFCLFDHHKKRFIKKQVSQKKKKKRGGGEGRGSYKEILQLEEGKEKIKEKRKEKMKKKMNCPFMIICLFVSLPQ